MEKKLFLILNRIIEVLMAALIITMVAANFWQIFTRFVLNHAADWTEEYMRYALIWLTMIGVPYAYGKDKHIALEFVADKFSTRGKVLDSLFVELVVLFLSVFVMILGGVLVTKNAIGQVSPALNIPMQFYYIGVPICGSLMVLYSIPKIAGSLRALRGTNKKER